MRRSISSSVLKKWVLTFIPSIPPSDLTDTFIGFSQRGEQTWILSNVSASLFQLPLVYVNHPTPLGVGIVPEEEQHVRKNSPKR